ncbi:MAG: hypothetical protein QM813_15285 [Verrucomicrobiota bacterium]
MSDLTNIPSNSPATSTSDSSELTELKATCTALESQTHSLRVVLLIVVFALAVFFWREADYNGALAAGMQPQVAQISQFAAQLEKQGSSFEKQLQVLQGAAQKLADYGKMHPDYAQILAKYGIVVAAAPAPTAVPAAKPLAPAPSLRRNNLGANTFRLFRTRWELSRRVFYY